MAKAVVAQFIGKHEALVHSALAGTVMSAAALNSQLLTGAATVKEGNASEIDWWLVARMGSYGALIGAPMLRAWFRYIDRVVPLPKRSPAAVVLKIAAELAVFSPVQLCLVFSYNVLLVGRPPADILVKIDKELLPTWGRGAMFWGSVGAVNYSLVPLRFRPPFVFFFSFIWNTYLSLVIERQVPPPSTVSESVAEIVSEQSTPQ